MENYNRLVSLFKEAVGQEQRFWEPLLNSLVDRTVYHAKSLYNQGDARPLVGIVSVYANSLDEERKKAVLKVLKPIREALPPTPYELLEQRIEALEKQLAAKDAGTPAKKKPGRPAKKAE